MRIRLLIKKRIDKTVLLYILVSFISAGILLLVYFFKGIYPFGSLTVGYGDMDQHYIPFSYHIYDVIHYGKSLFWDPYLGTGSNIFGIEALAGMFSPISWLVILTTRENIPQFISFLLIIRAMLLSITSLIFMNRVFRETPAFWRISLSVMYAFCGYILIFYTNMAWVDCAILFPLLLLSLKDLYENNRFLGYLCVLSVHLIISYYISFMALLFVFFTSGVVLFFFVEKERRKKIILRLGVGTVGALLLTAFVTIPAFLQSTGSSRYDAFSYRKILEGTANSDVLWNKIDFFFFAGITLVVFLKILAGFWLNRRKTLFFILLIALTTAQVFVEGINLIWYGGSYVCYPLRFGYMPLFLLLAGCAWYFSPDHNKKHTMQSSIIKPDRLSAQKDMPVLQHIDTTKTQKQNNLTPHSFVFKMLRFLAGAAAFASFGTAVWIGKTYLADSIKKSLYGYWGIDIKSSMLFGAAAGLIGLTLWIVLKIRSKKIQYSLLSIIFFTEIFLHCFWYIGITPRDGGHIDDWMPMANELYDDTSAERESRSISRWKDADSVMNANYPLVFGGQAVSSYLHLIREGQQNVFDSMGYSTNYTRILDTGGTLFSDMLLNVNHIMTTTEYSQDVFELLKKSGEFYLYKCKYTLPTGIVFSKTDTADEETDSNGAKTYYPLQKGISPLINQNLMYQALFGETDNLINMVNPEPQFTNVTIGRVGEQLSFRQNDAGKPGRIIYSIPVDGSNFLYLGAKALSGSIQIFVNHQALSVATFGNSSNFWFPASYNNNILNLGLYEDETVTVEIVINSNVTFNYFSMGLLPMEKIAALSSQETSLPSQSQNSFCDEISIRRNTVYAEAYAAQDGQSLFLPINCDDGWECAVNGKSIEVDKIFGTFILLDLQKGSNAVELQFFPKGFKESAAISLATLGLMLLVAAIWLVRRKRSARNRLFQNKVAFTVAGGLTKIVYAVYWAVYFTALTVVYIVPILFAFAAVFK